MSIEMQIREVVKEAVREELRTALNANVTALIGSTVKTDRGDYLTVAQAAESAGVHEATIRTWIRRGALVGHRAGRHHRIRRSELESFMAGRGPSDEFDLDDRAAAMAAM